MSKDISVSLMYKTLILSGVIEETKIFIKPELSISKDI